jgi:hypothetical protein
MPLTAEQRAELIDGLISNCDCWDDDDRELLNSFKDEKLTSFTENLSSPASKDKSETLNLGDVGVDDLKAEIDRRKELVGNDEDPKPEDTTNQEKDDEWWVTNAPESVKRTFQYAHQIESDQKAALVDKLTAHITDNAERNIQRERLMTRTPDELRADLSLLPEKATTENAEAGQEENLIDRVLNSLSGAPAEKPLLPPSMNFEEGAGDSKGATVDNTEAKEWLKKAPTDVRKLIANALAVETQQKDEIIDKLVANVSDTNTRFRLREDFAKRPLQELKDMLVITGNADAKDRKPNYAGASTPGMPISNARKLTEKEKQDILPIPKMTFGAG